jgi:hypothetical protein
MGGSYWNIIVFVLTTIAYYLSFKPKLTLDIINNKEEYAKFNKDSYFRLGVYFLFVILFQYAINIGVVANKCGGSIGQNIGAAALFTFVPWILIFGIVIIVLLMFPGFKSAFSDVIGYFIVSSSANNILTEILIDPNINDKIEEFGKGGDENNTNVVVSENPDALVSNELTNSQMGGTSKKQLQNAADAIIKLCGNMSILINQLVPSNFNDYWSILTPLMKEQYQNNNPETLKKKQELLDIVSSRDNIGEGFWFGYTALLITSIVQYNITSRGCSRNMKQMQEDYDKFLDKEEEAKKKKEEVETTYTLGPTNA